MRYLMGTGRKQCSKIEAMRIARELMYGRDVIEKIKNAESPEEISRIMNSARSHQIENELNVRTEQISLRKRRGKK